VSKLIKFIINNRERLLKCSAEGATIPEALRQKDRKILTLERRLSLTEGINLSGKKTDGVKELI